MSVSMRPRGRAIARLGVTPLTGTDGGYPWHDGELLYADDLNAAVTASTVSVLEFDAKGDGVTDDTLAIQAAMNTYAGKAVVYIPDTGHPYMVGPLTLPTGLSLWLDGTLKLIAAASNSLIDFTGQSNITITGHGKLDGNGPVQVETGLGISVLSGTCTNLRVYGITVTNAHFWNVNLTGCSNVRLDGINILGPNGAANEFAVGCDDCWLLNSLVDGTGLGDYSFCFYGGCTNCGAIGNTVRNGAVGLTGFTPPGIGILSDGPAGTPTAIQCRNITIADNIIHNCGGPGISCINVSGGVQSGILISNNRCHHNNQIGAGGVGGADIFIDQSEDVMIIGNHSSANGTGGGTQFTGIFLGPNASKVSVISNHIYNTGQGSGATASAGLWSFGIPHLYVSGNHFYDTQAIPTMQYSIIGNTGPHSAIVGNFFDVPYNLGPAVDTVLANVINGTWMEGGLTGADVSSVIQGASGHRVSLQYQTGYIPRWFAGTDSSSASNYEITRVDDSGVQHSALSINRISGIVNVPSYALFVGDGTATSGINDVVFAVNGAPTQNKALRFVSNGLARFDILVNDDPEGGNLEFITHKDDGSSFSPLFITRATGLLTIVTPPPFANDAAAAAGGIVVGGIYRNGSALQVRVT